jgi:hypothetical protein
MPGRTPASASPVPLPIVAGKPGRPLRLSPTDVSQFVRLEQCERFLRFRLAERAGQRFMDAYDVTPQRITPLLTRSGREFERAVEQAVGKQLPFVAYAAKEGGDGNRPDNNAEVADVARRLKPGQVVVLSQPRLHVELEGWLIRGDVDLLRLERHAGGALHALIADMKSTTAVKVDHRLQVAFYHLMLARLFQKEGIACNSIRTGILFRGPADAPPDDPELGSLREAAREWFGLEDTLLELVDDPDAYLQSVRDLVTGADSAARRIAAAPFDELPFALSYKCDGCLYNEFCMKWSAEHEDLSLLPYLSGIEKEALRRAGVRTIQDLAALKDFPPSPTAGGKGDLVAAAGKESLVKRLAATWPVGPRLDELVHRARSFRRSVRKDGTAALGYIPGKGTSSLPVASADLNPNLVWVYLDAQHDYLTDRIYLLGALVVGRQTGSPDPKRRRSIVRITDGPPERAEQERQLFADWTREVIKAVVELAAPGEQRDGRNTAPLHLVFFNRYEQRLLLEALARNFPPILEAAPPLYDFLTQLAAFDTPVATFLDEEARDFRNFPMTCQSLQSLATYLKFDWNSPQPFRELFKARLFDYLGKLDIDGVSEWFTRRSRFNSQVPLEYAYAAWKQLPSLPKGKADDFGAFRGVTKGQLLAFQARRLEAIEHVARSFPGNPLTRKTPFVLPDLSGFEDKAQDLAQALHEFVTIERHVELADWKRTRHAPPERRVLMGETLLVRYVETDQESAVARAMKDYRRRRQLRKEYEAAYQAAHPGEPVELTKSQKEACKWSWGEGLTVRLRLETAGVDCGLHEALALSNLRPGESLVLCPRWTVDERLPPDQQQPFTPTPKQVLYGSRCDLSSIVTDRDGQGHITGGHVEAMLRRAFGNKAFLPFVFGAIDRPLEDGGAYTLDPCPDDWYGYFCSVVVQGLQNGDPNALYDRLDGSPPAPAGKVGRGLPGQERFLAGLDAFRDAGLLHDFEKSKREYIGKHGKAPTLLVQGPPGTGKSYSTAFAVFARLQGAMAAGQECRVLVSCKTHAATDVLMRNVLDVREELLRLRKAKPTLFKQHFDARLLEVPIFRVAPRDPPPEGVIGLDKDGEKPKGQKKNADVLQGHTWLVAAVTPGGVYRMLKDRWGKELAGHSFCDLLVLDEASQMNLPEAFLAALPFKADGRLIVVGDHRQMPPIVKHEWDSEPRRTFHQYPVYQSLFDTLRGRNPPLIQFEESFRLHAAVAEFLRREVYRHDGIEFHSKKQEVLAAREIQDPMVAAVLRPEYPLVVVVHGEAASQVRNEFEQRLIEPVIRTLADPKGYALDAEKGLGVVVPHRAQRAALQAAFPQLSLLDPESGLPVLSAIDTVERFQGGERTVILVSATESDPGYLLMAGEFLFDPRRLTVALSRAKRKLILVASRSVFSLFSPDEETFMNAMLWKNLLANTCVAPLWEGVRGGVPVAVWGGR